MSIPTITAQPIETSAEIRRQAVKSIAKKIVIAVGITVTAHVISNLICDKIDEKMYPETETPNN